MLTILCRVGNDPEIKTIPSGATVMRLSLAYAYGRKGADGKRPTEWIETSMWGKQAEALQPYVKKGDQISVSIKDLHNERYPKKDGTEGVKLVGEIVAFEFASNGKSAQPAEAKPATTSKPGTGQGFDDFNDDIPFN